jgi:hypothetical protein
LRDKDGGGQGKGTAAEDNVALRNAPIEMVKTFYGWFLTTQKRDAKQAFQHMDAAEREAFLWRLTEIDTADIKDG